MEIKWYITLLTALIPMAVGFIWYNPKVLGKNWMQEALVTDAMIKSGNPAKIFGLAFLFSLMIAFVLPNLVIHQSAIYGLLNTELRSDDPTIKDVATKQVQSFMAAYGGKYRTFGHGALHGFILSLFIGLPIIATNALFERKSTKYIFINWGYWAVSLLLMGGVICQWG